MNKAEMIEKVNGLKNYMLDHSKDLTKYTNEARYLSFNVSDKKADEIMDDFDSICQNYADDHCIINDSVGDVEENLNIHFVDEIDRLDDSIEMGDINKADLVRDFGDDYKKNLQTLRRLNDQGFIFYIDNLDGSVDSLGAGLVFMILDDFDYDDYFDEVA